MNKQKQILDALKIIIDPDLGKDIVTLNFIKNLNIKNGNVNFDIRTYNTRMPY